MKQLKQQEIRDQISIWMSRLFDKDVHVENVKLHVEKVTQEIVKTQLKNETITIDKLQQLFKIVENEFNKSAEKVDN